MAIGAAFFRGLARTGVALALGVALSAALTPVQAQTAPPAGANEIDEAPSADIGAIASVDLAPRPALTLNGSADWDDGLTAVMGALDKLRSELAKAGLEPGGKPLSVFTDTDDQGFKFTAMLPLAQKPASDPALGQNVKLGETPAGKTMKFEHRGSYDDIDTSYEAITAYLDEKGLEAQNLFIEEYLTTPKGPEDPDLQVDIYVFLK